MAVSTYEELPLRSQHWSVRWHQQVPADVRTTHVQLVLPDGACDVIVDERGQARLVGPTAVPEHVPLAPGAQVRGLRLRPGWLATVLRVDADELRDRTVPLDAVARPRQAARLTAAALGDPAAMRALESGTAAPDGRVQAAVDLLEQRARITLDEVGAAVGASPRQLRRLFHRHTGLGPKTMQRVLRLERFLALAEAQGADLADAAYCGGFSDQAHLTREVGELSGLAPVQLLRRRAAA